MARKPKIYACLACDATSETKFKTCPSCGIAGSCNDGGTIPTAQPIEKPTPYAQHVATADPEFWG